MNSRGFEKRVKSPTSATSTTALISATPHHLQGVNDRAQIPFRQKAEDLFLDSLQAPFRIRDHIDIVLKHNPLSGIFEGQRR
jgi:hypothetical protein